MKFILDNDVPDEVGHALLRQKLDAIFMREALPRDATDDEVFKYAIRENRIILTCNWDDFRELGRGQPHPGIILLERRFSRLNEAAAVVRLIRRLGKAGFSGKINYA